MRLFCSFKYRNGEIAEYLQIGGDDDMDWALFGQFGSEYLCYGGNPNNIGDGN